MKKHLLIGLALTTALSGPAFAESVPGWYTGVEGGVIVPSDLRAHQLAAPSASYSLDPKIGWTGGVFGGYDFNGPRLELEANYRRAGLDHVDGIAATGNVHAWSGMLNLMYDFNADGRLKPYVGVGGGAARVTFRNVGPLPAGGPLDGSKTVPAYQGIAGVSYDLNDSWAVRLDGRYFATKDPKITDATGVLVKSRYHEATAMLGLVYKFGQPGMAAAPAATAQYQAATPPPAAPVAAPPAPTINAGPFLAFFDWGSADITADAEKTLQDAATASNQGHPVSVIVSGHADRSGSAAYNMGLSQRRADAVKAELNKLGIDSTIVTTKAFGETEPLVATKDGVREPQNRRVEIVFPKQ